ncbi:MAG: hypothetical protein SGJ11_11610, partial [Phycisphaerae bacterium]|nr:hypothetical protein [Phycisphaerae bacterium]
ALAASLLFGHARSHVRPGCAQLVLDTHIRKFLAAAGSRFRRRDFLSKKVPAKSRNTSSER